MIAGHRLQEALDEMREITRMDFALYTAKGVIAAATYEPEDDVTEAVQAFAESMAESQMLAGSHFFKVSVEGETEYVLLVVGSADDAYMVGRLAVCQIRNIVAANMEQFDKNSFIQNVLLGNMLAVDIYQRAQKLHIEQAERVVYVIELARRGDATVMELVRNLFVTKNKDFVTEIDEQSIILVKDTRGMPQDEDLASLADMIVDNLHAEAMVRVRVGYGTRVENLMDIAKSYQEAKMALEVGRVFYAEQETFAYSRLGIGRLIYQLPKSLCEMFLQEVFGGEVPDIFNDENLTTIQKFFENNLNISETARQLFIHRNTLVYRLERLEKIIGLDIRKFDDAMTFKIAMMVIERLK